MLDGYIKGYIYKEAASPGYQEQVDMNMREGPQSIPMAREVPDPEVEKYYRRFLRIARGEAPPRNTRQVVYTPKQRRFMRDNPDLFSPSGKAPIRKDPAATAVRRPALGPHAFGTPMAGEPWTDKSKITG